MQVLDIANLQEDLSYETAFLIWLHEKKLGYFYGNLIFKKITIFCAYKLKTLDIRIKIYRFSK
jgi:hypothetical protein